MSRPPVVDLRVVGRITPASVRGLVDPLRACIAEGRPFRALFDRRALGAPTAEGRAALAELYADWGAVAGLVVAWADVYDPRRAASLERARRARADRGLERSGPAYPYGLFDDLATARTWLDTDALSGSARPLAPAR